MQENTESVIIRVLLNAREASKFDLFCDIDGLSATLEIVKVCFRRYIVYDSLDANHFIVLCGIFTLGSRAY